MEIHLLQGDITKVKVDAIVNAANRSLLGGGGVDGAIHASGGPAIMEECQQIRKEQGGCKVGEAVMTTAGNLKASSVIHTVGPIWEGGTQNEKGLLKNCYLNSLRLADKKGCYSIAFPNIGTGTYEFPRDQAAAIAVSTVNGFQAKTIKRVLFVCFDPENYAHYTDLLNRP